MFSTFGMFWPVKFGPFLCQTFANIRHLYFPNSAYLDNLRRRTSPTILTDCDQLNFICSYGLFPDGIGDHFDGSNASAGQALTKWLHIPRKDGPSKRLFCADYGEEVNLDWVNNFKEAFLRATASVSYKILFAVHKTSIGTFELVNERTQEKLTLLFVEEIVEEDGYEFTKKWLLNRCPISEKAAIQWENDENWDDNLNSVHFSLWGDINKSIGPLSPPAEEEKEKADESNEK